MFMSNCKPLSNLAFIENRLCPYSFHRVTWLQS